VDRSSPFAFDSTEWVFILSSFATASAIACKVRRTHGWLTLTLLCPASGNRRASSRSWNTTYGTRARRRFRPTMNRDAMSKRRRVRPAKSTPFNLHGPRPTAPFYADFYPFRVIAPDEYAEDRSSAGKKCLQRSCRTHLSWRPARVVLEAVENCTQHDICRGR